MSPTPDRPGHQVNAAFYGPVHGQAAAGVGIQQTHAIGDTAVAAVTHAQLEELRSEFTTLRAEVEAQAPPEERAAAVERVEELEEAVLAERPDVTTIRYVAQWFGRNLPKLAAAVTSVVIHPIVGQLVEQAGEMLAGDFRRLMGAED
jgi:hypothetical protein